MKRIENRAVIEPPEIIFSEWVRWDERARLKSRDGEPSPGVYVWGRFAQAPPPNLRPYPEIPEELIYVGETKDLNVRPLGRGRHHRLTHYSDCFPEDRSRGRLYVSVFHVPNIRGAESRCVRVPLPDMSKT
jgi:hypothetical protein